MPTPSRSNSAINVGTAGWSIPTQHAALFPASGSHLERYAQIFLCAEINSTFYRPHRPSTYTRWALSTPEHFRFSVKAPKAITHECSLVPTRAQFENFLKEASHLGSKLGPILFQFPPRQAFDPTLAREFFSLFRDLHPTGQAAAEPRHADWFTVEADTLLDQFHIARVAADPPPVPAATRPAGYKGLVYSRLHGSPRMYYSSYPAEWITQHAATLRACAETAEVWCIFDNTASGAAIDNAFTLRRNLAFGKES